MTAFSKSNKNVLEAKTVNWYGDGAFSIFAIVDLFQWLCEMNNDNYFIVEMALENKLDRRPNKSQK